MQRSFGIVLFALCFSLMSFATQESLSSQPARGWKVAPADEKGYSRAYISPDQNCVVSVRSNRSGVRILTIEKSRDGDDVLWQTTTITKRPFLRALLSLFRNRVQLAMEFEEWHNGQLVRDTKGDDGTPDLFFLKYADHLQELPPSDRKLFWNRYDSHWK